jgi:hypothetical protein
MLRRANADFGAPRHGASRRFFCDACGLHVASDESSNGMETNPIIGSVADQSPWLDQVRKFRICTSSLAHISSGAWSSLRAPSRRWRNQIVLYR